MTEQTFERLRHAMVVSQLRTTGVSDARVLAAMAAVPRERFVDEGLRTIAYLDRPLALGAGRAMPAPMVLGRLLTEARTGDRDRVLVIGAGSGYAASVAAALAGTVTALEEADILPAAAAAPSIAWAQGPLAAGVPDAAPYDVILFDGAVEQIPSAIIEQLAEGGRLVVPIVDHGVIRLAIGHKASGAFGLATFADAEAPILPGFAAPAAFRF